MKGVNAPLLIDRPLKVLLLGDSGVGKTCIMLRLSENKFSEAHVATIGIDFKLETIPVDNGLVKLQIWDTAGQERFRNLTQTYFRNAKAVLLVYDVGDMKSFQNIELWLRQLDRNSGIEIAKALVGNKKDLAEELWEVTDSQAKELATKHRMPHIYTSASSGENIREAFQIIARQVIGREGSKKYPATVLASDNAFYPLLSDVFEAKKKSACC